MTLIQLIYAVKIADVKSMNKAASELFVSQPALSGAIRELEDEIHTELFIRSNRGIVITTEGEEFLRYARQMVELHTLMGERYIEEKQYKKKFSVSMQHYSFAVEAFIKLANQLTVATKPDGKESGGPFLSEFELAVHETKTYEVIENIKNFRSEIGVLFLNDFNEKVLKKIFADNDLEFIPLFDCGISVYLSKFHPLSGKEKLSLEELSDYPCLSFEQGEKNSFYFAEEVLSTLDYKQIIKADDRATMLNLMVGMKGYTLCSGIICEELNGGDYLSIPLDTQDKMTIGYLKRKKIPLTFLGEKYIEILKTYECKNC